MTLRAVRDKFIEASGRYDLINENGSDNGANDFINRAQKWLDQRLDEPIPACRRRVQKDVVTGAFSLCFSYCRSIHEVWVSDGETRWQLDRRSIKRLRTDYPTPWNEIDGGAPDVFAETVAKLGPEQRAVSQGNYDDDFSFDREDLNLPGADSGCCPGYAKRKIVFLPPADKTLTVSVWGLFYNPKLTEDEDESYWTEVHPETLVLAALYILEGQYRNSEGMNDWIKQIQMTLTAIDHDSVEDSMPAADAEGLTAEG